MADIDFSDLRKQWALKYNPTKDRIDMEFRSDQMANPHNEPYHNKRPRRTEGQIVSDLCYHFADQALAHQYGHQYKDWLIANCKEDHFTHVWKER